MFPQQHAGAIIGPAGQHADSGDEGASTRKSVRPGSAAFKTTTRDKASKTGSK